MSCAGSLLHFRQRPRRWPPAHEARLRERQRQAPASFVASAPLTRRRLRYPDAGLLRMMAQEVSEALAGRAPRGRPALRAGR
jgi:hypothetical protein